MHIQISLIIALLASICEPLSAQYAAAVQIDQSVRFPVAFDADNDGDLDMAYVGSGRVSISMNTGQGLFTQFKMFPTPHTNISDLGAADVDLDGDLDLVVLAGTWDTTSFWMANDGNGNFTFGALIPINIQQGLSDSRQFYEDINGDSLPDVFISTMTSERMSINNWPGAFTPLYSTVYAGIPVLGDIDLDGQLDLVGRRNNYELHWWSALTGQMDTIGDLANYPEWLEVFDLDQDGDSDVVSFSSGHVNVFLNDTATGFVPGLSITCPTFNSKKTNIVDLDGDGLPDIVLFMTSDSLAFLRNLGNGEFDPPVNILDMNGITPEFFADINNDGRPDLVTTGASWFAGLPGLQFAPSRAAVFYARPNGAVSWGDMDGDGDLDIMQGGCWLEQTAPAVLDRVHTTTESAINTAPADLNGDGQMDCYTFWIDGNNSELIQYMHGEEGAWPATQIVAGYGEQSEVLKWDPDGDGDVDLLECIFGNEVRGFRNDGQGTLSLENMVGVDAAQAYRPAIADFDGDGDEDFAAIGGGYLRIYSNLGNWTFSSITLTTAGWGGGNSAIKHIRAADMDMDGSPDIVIDKGGQLSWFQNIGGQGAIWMSHELDVPVSVGFFAFELADVDMDGDTDILYLPPHGTAPQFGIALNWLSNEGQSGFSAPQTILPQNGNDLIIGVRALDLDADMDPDLLVSIIPNGAGTYRTMLLLDTMNYTLNIPYEKRASQLTAYPVPADRSVTIQVDQETLGDGWFSLSDPEGRLLRTWRAVSPGAFTIDRNGLASGIYLLSLRSSQHTSYSTRIVFQ